MPRQESTREELINWVWEVLGFCGEPGKRPGRDFLVLHFYGLSDEDYCQISKLLVDCLWMFNMEDELQKLALELGVITDGIARIIGNKEWENVDLEKISPLLNEWLDVLIEGMSDTKEICEDKIRIAFLHLGPEEQRIIFSLITVFLVASQIDSLKTSNKGETKAGEVILGLINDGSDIIERFQSESGIE